MDGAPGVGAPSVLFAQALSGTEHVGNSVLTGYAWQLVADGSARSRHQLDGRADGGEAAGGPDRRVDTETDQDSGDVGTGIDEDALDTDDLDTDRIASTDA